jgi:glycosyltransferase involved in cell wall biosynthesis
LEDEEALPVTERSPWLLYDDKTTGHHLRYGAGVLGAVRDLGVPVIAATSYEPPAGTAWHQTRQIGVTSPLALARQIRLAAKSAQESGAEAFVHLYMDKNVWGPTRPLRGFASACVIHHTTRFLKLRPGLAGLRSRFLVERLKKLTDGGMTVIVHTKSAEKTIAEELPNAQITTIGYPIEPPPPVARRPKEPVPTLLFAGSARPEKGLAYLLKALPRVTKDVRVLVMGRQDPETRAKLEPLANGRVTWVDRYVETEELVAAYQTCTLAIVPYDNWFGTHGGASGILLETLAFAAPAVISGSIAGQLPDDYQGAVIVEPESPEALAAGIEEALGSVERLTEGAAAQGPEFIRQNHSFPGYARSLVKAVEEAMDR